MKPIIDISVYQGETDLALAMSRIDGVIARCSYGWSAGQIDAQWAHNAKQANDLGIPLGAYHFAYARNEEEAKKEAKLALSAIKGYRIRVLYYDLEYTPQQGNLSNEQLYAIAKAFCDEIEAVGIPVGIYANTDWFRNKLTNPGFAAWTLWLADYGTNSGYDEWNGKLLYDPFDHVLLHQFTSRAKQGVLKGIEGIPSEGLDASSDHGWLQTWNKDHVYEETTAGGTPSLAHRIGERVYFDVLFASSTSTTPLKALIHSGTITKILAGRRNPYLINDGSGWLNDVSIIEQLFQIGDQVMVKQGVGATWVNQVPIAGFVYQNVYTIMELSNASQTAVIGINGKVTGRISMAYLKRA